MKSCAQHVFVDGMYRSRRGRSPLRYGRFCRTGHDRSVVEKRVVMEQGGGCASLPPPLPPLSRDHRVAKHWLEKIELYATFWEVHVTAEQQSLHQFGTSEERDSWRSGSDG